MSESLGSARIDLELDLTNFNVTLDRAKGQMAGMNAETRKAFDGASGDIKKAQTTLMRYIQQLGLSADNTKLLSAAMRGVDPKFIQHAADEIQKYRLNVAAAEREQIRFAESQAFDKQLAEARKMVQASEYIRFWEDALQDAEVAQARVASQQQFISSLQQQANAVGKTRAELLELKAAEMGVADQAAPFIAKLKAQEAALRRGGVEFNQYGLSAKMTAAALRQVPAQMTDIFVSLQGGQAPLTVLLQQGGQLRDIFGGITPALKAMGSGLLGLINPATLLGAAGGALLYAWYEGEKESNRYAQALALTGARAGLTTSQLQTMAQTMQDSITTQGRAAEALVAVASSGKFVGEQFVIVADSAERMRRATGKALDETIAQFSELAKDPVAAVAKLNDQTHFLTLETFKQIEALQKQGDTQAAATLAMRTYADAVKQRTQEVEQNLGTLQTAWREVANFARQAWDAMLDIGREDTVQDRIDNLRNMIGDVINPGTFSMYKDMSVKARAQTLGALSGQLRAALEEGTRDAREAAKKASEQEANDYAIAQEQNILAHRSADERRAAEIARSFKESELKAAKAIAAGNPELATAIRANQKSYEAALRAEGSKGRGQRGIDNSQAKLELQAFKDTLAEEQAAITNSTQILQAQYSAKLVSAEEYYAQMRALMQRDIVAQETALTGQIAVLQARNVTGKDALDVQRQIATLESELARVRAEAATKAVILGVQEQQLADQRKQAVDAYKRALDEENRALEMEFALRAAAVGMGQREFALMQQVTQAYADQAAKLRELVVQKDTRQITEAQYREDVENLQRATDEKVRIVREGFAAMARAQQDWRAGLAAGMTDWMDEASNTAGQLREMVGKDMSTIENSLVNAAETGKFAWRQMLIDMLRELERFLIKQAMLKAAYSFFGGGSGEAGGYADLFASDSFSYFAKGGVSAAPSLKKYSNSVYDTPQYFAFANGGVFGEAGAEAIMPLAKDSTGELGVKIKGGIGGAAEVNVTIATTINSDGSSKTTTSESNAESERAYKQFADRMRIVAQEEIQRQMRPGGNLWKVGVTVR